MEMTTIYTIVGFALAGYSVIANDSIQTLGTFIASKQKWFKWYTLASAASFVMILAITWGWYSNAGDISYGRLTRIPFPRNTMVSCCGSWNTFNINKNRHTCFNYIFSTVSICINCST